MLAAAFYPKDVIVRLSDFKSNEYANLVGGHSFEPTEDNPMIGWRGASRYYSEKYKKAFTLECKALRKVREEMGLSNVKVMVPFCRTIEEGKKVIQVMAAKTVKPFDYVSNPEFLKEGAAVEDFMKPDRVIIGTSNPAVMDIMRQLYAPFMRKSSRIIFMDPASAEMTKYAANAMLAARISFMNEISGLCEKYGADIELIRMGIGSDSRIGNAFIFPGLGYGGSCFPKDVRALIFQGEQQDCPMTIARAVQQANLTQQDRFARRVLDYFGDRSSILPKS